MLFLLLAIAFHLNFSCFYHHKISIFGFESQNTYAKSRICVLIQSKMLEKINTTQPYKSTLGPKIEKRIKATFQISCKWRTHFLKINKHWYSAYSAGESRDNETGPRMRRLSHGNEQNRTVCSLIEESMICLSNL